MQLKYFAKINALPFETESFCQFSFDWNQANGGRQADTPRPGVQGTPGLGYSSSGTEGTKTG
ncbi:hypothetical protein [Agrobacterium larrymoorei]|uniref:Uncharacterized protein n=1 Tax=Agrobacterium larrymoorei TaxID=160699 RepID=A0AAF0H6F0_9HYPH|nr:hypothetical protein [Agrobacterium larrymoorei]WHA40606.1 hypothetical protein CFBP5477_012370 [Agrobacterium larrymoorei]